MSVAIVGGVEGHPLVGSEAACLCCDVLSDFATAARLAAEWDEFVEGGGHELYQTYDWCATWWKFYGAGRELRIYVYRVAGRIVGILPMFHERVWLGPVGLRLAKLVGADFSLQMCTPAIDATWAQAVHADVLHRMLIDERVDAIWFAPLSGAHDALTPLRRALYEQQEMVTVARERILAPQAFFALPESFDAYINGLSKRQKQNYRRDHNLLTKKFRVKVDTMNNAPEAEKGFDQFKRMHDAQWAAHNRLGHFGDWPRSEEFNRELVRRLDPLGRYRMVRLLADEQVVSYQYIFRFGSTYYWRLPARLPEADWDRYGLGRMGLIKMIEVAIGEGVRYIEAGAGHYDYKVQLGAVELPLRGVLAVANRMMSRSRSRVFVALADILHMAYYRAYYTRWASALPLKRRALWTAWIKSHM